VKLLLDECVTHSLKRDLAEMLQAKGFILEGDEPLSVQINRLLHTEKMDD
jgi:hypothetical protein